MNGFKLFYGCFVCTMKYNEDRYNSNKFYSKVCGASFKDLLMMEYITLKYFIIFCKYILISSIFIMIIFYKLISYISPLFNWKIINETKNFVYFLC